MLSTFISYTRAAAAATILSLCAASCSTDGGDEPSPGTPVTGEVEFTVDLPEGVGDATNADPAVVPPGEELSLTVSQTSTYADPDGSTFTCEPRVSIQVSAAEEIVHAATIDDLRAVTPGSEIHTDTQGSSPQVVSTVQQFEVGGNRITFDLTHEVYTHINSKRQAVEMPYIKPSAARLGSNTAVEAGPDEPLSRASAPVVTAVTVRPLLLSRGETVTESKEYAVSVRFSLDLESKNTKQSASRTLEFEVNYVGVVETTVELLDPAGELSYDWILKRGNATLPPHVSIARGCKEAELWMKQTSSYTDEYGNTATASPKATVNITVARDTVWAPKVDDLRAFAPLGAADAADGQGAAQQFGSQLQTVAIDWHYETAAAALGGAEVTLPHYELLPARLTAIDVKEGEVKSIGGREVALYDIAATFTQRAVAVGLPEGSASAAPAEVEVEYVVNYTGAAELTLVKVEYIPGGQWIDPHDNLMLAFYPKVERYRTYSNGMRIGPDEFYDLGHPAMAFVSSEGYNEHEYYEIDGEWLMPHAASYTNIGDSIVIQTRSVQLSNLGTLRYSVLDDRYDYHIGGDWFSSDTMPLDWSYYTHAYPYDNSYDSYNLGVDLENDEYESVSLPSGWYLWYLENTKFIAIHWGMESFERQILLIDLNFSFHDQFLAIDGKRIDFKKLHGYDLKHNFEDIPFADATKEGHIYKATVDATYLGKNFHAECIDSVFVAR